MQFYDFLCATKLQALPARVGYSVLHALAATSTRAGADTGPGRWRHRALGPASANGTYGSVTMVEQARKIKR